MLIWQDLLLLHLRGGEAVFYYFISFVGLSHWKVSSADEELSFAQGLGECLVHSRGSINISRMNLKSA